MVIIKVNMTSHANKNQTHIPKNSLFFEKVIPVLLVLMGIVTISLILFAAGVLLGIIHF